MNVRAHMRTSLTLLTVALLACALLPAAASAAPERTVAVTAKATVKVPNDLATIGIGVKRERKTRGEALQAASAKLRQVIATVQTIAGVGEGDVRTGRISVRPVKKGHVTVYRASEGAKVTLHEPSKAGELVAKALAAGATGVSGPYFSVGSEEEAFDKALAAAFQKAKARATILATQAGATLGKAIVIEEGEGQISYPGGQFEGSLIETESAAAPVAKAPPPRPSRGPRPCARPCT